MRAVVTLFLLLFALTAVTAFSAGYFFTLGEIRATETDAVPCLPQPETWRRA